MTPLRFFLIFAIASLGLLAFYYLLTWFKASRFDGEYNYLDELIKRSDVTKQAYSDITGKFLELDCNTDTEKKRKKSLWHDFMRKFKSVAHYVVKEEPEVLQKSAGV